MTSQFVNLAPNTRTYVVRENTVANFKPAALAPTRADRKSLAYGAEVGAERATETTLLPKLDALKAAGLLQSYEVIRGTGSLVVNVPEARAGEAYKALQGVAELGRVVRNRAVTLDDTVDDTNATARAGGVPEYNVAKVNAPAAWAAGATGAGVTIGIVDTGADVTHEALKGHYRGAKEDGTVDNNYNWYDPRASKVVPYDDHGHGSHVAGTATGGTADQVIGVAPGAKFISAKVFSASGSSDTATILKGLGWMLAPTDSTGQNADPTKAPDIVSNSWGNSNGATLVYQNALRAFQAAGITPVFAAGNSGPSPRTVGAPGSYPESLTIGATDSNDKVASFSSRGPSALKDANGNPIAKPDFAAPGVAVVSAKPGGGYQKMSGTSMATPAAAGVVALLLSKYPELGPEKVREILAKSALDLGTAGTDPDYGAGRIDASAALALAAKMTEPPAPPTNPTPPTH